MAPLTFADTHSMVAFFSKSDASEGFDQIVDFLNAHTIKYALMVNPTIYVSCIKQFWATAIVKKCLSTKRTTWNEFSYSMASAVICLAIVVMDNQVADMTSHNTIYTSHALTQNVAELEKDKHSQALEIIQLKKRVKKLEKKKKSEFLQFKRLRKEGKIEAIDADEGITLVDAETNKEIVAMDAEPQGMTGKGVSVVSAPELVSLAEPTVFDDEDVRMTMA
nr:hypothetical protein [Tanacetum cinerariifolium]